MSESLSSPVQATAVGFQRELVLLDRAVALERVGGDPQLLQEIAQLFLEQAPELIDQMRTALAAGDAKVLERAAHTFKGAVGNFGAEPALEAAKTLEFIARGGDLARAQGAFGRLQVIWEQLLPEFVRLSRETPA